MDREETEELPGSRNHGMVEREVRARATGATAGGGRDGHALGTMRVRAIEEAVERGAKVKQGEPGMDDEVDTGEVVSGAQVKAA